MTPSTATPSWLSESAGAVADLGVLVPIAVALIVLNGLSPTAVLLPAALLYLLVARIYRLPIAVQPLKAFGAIAIAAGASSDVIAAGALLMGVIFTFAGSFGIVDTVARWIPTAVVRGVQLTVAILLAKVGWGLIAHTPENFTNQLPSTSSFVVVAVLTIGLWFLRGRLSLAAVGVAVIAMAYAALTNHAALAFGPTSLAIGMPSTSDFVTAFTLLVLPQLPLTFANSCLAPADAARTYFGSQAKSVTAGRLAQTLGLANLFAGGISGMPVCHGAGGLSAHYAFGARTWRAPALMGIALAIAALALGSTLVTALPAFPVAVLSALLGVAAITHAMLLRDVRGTPNWVIVAIVAGLGVATNLAYGVIVGLFVAIGMGRIRR